MITLINCKLKLESLGVYMEQIGSGALFIKQLAQKMFYISWDYDFEQDQIKIWIKDGSEIPDLSDIGEVISYEPTIG